MKLWKFALWVAIFWVKICSWKLMMINVPQKIIMSFLYKFNLKLINMVNVARFLFIHFSWNGQDWLGLFFFLWNHLGFCAEFNTNGALVQENYDANCKQHKPPCPEYYDSAKAYKCKLISYLVFFIQITYTIRYILRLMLLKRIEYSINCCLSGVIRFSIGVELYSSNLDYLLIRNLLVIYFNSVKK